MIILLFNYFYKVMIYNNDYLFIDSFFRKQYIFFITLAHYSL